MSKFIITAGLSIMMLASSATLQAGAVIKENTAAAKTIAGKCQNHDLSCVKKASGLKLDGIDGESKDGKARKAPKENAELKAKKEPQNTTDMFLKLEGIDGE